MRTVERVSVSAFVDPDDHERLVERARSEDRSVSAELRVAIREHLERQAVDRYPAHAGPTVGRIREPSS
jgi:post-segregation antitoxin (ccd killing protein)